MQLMFRRGILAGVTLWLLAAAVTPVWAANKDGKTPAPAVTGVLSGIPNVEFRVHKVGAVGLTVTNYGVLGTQFEASIKDPETGLSAPSCQFPYGSGIEYLFQGALWIGAVVDDDTLVSTGFDGWQFVFEMLPDALPDGRIVKRSTRPNDSAYSLDAVSDADYIATFYDTLTDQSYVHTDPYDGQPHTPLGLKIVQESYSWSASAYEDFIMFRYRIKNIGCHYLRKVYCGLYFDCDIWYPARSYGYTDDLSGSYRCFDPTTAESVFVAWSADDDGDPTRAEQWDEHSARGVFGVTLLDFPTEPQQSFNWWFSWGDTPSLDWGPRRQENNRDFGTGGLGTPSGDRNKYYIMSTPERDYDQIWEAVDLSSQGWLPPHSGIVSEYSPDTRFLLSFGSIDLAPGDSTEFALSVVMGDSFHRNPTDYDSLFDWNNPQVFYDSLDFSDLTTNILAARELYRQLFVVIPGDFDRSGVVNIADAVCLLNYLYLGGSAPRPLRVADLNGDCSVTFADAVYLIRYLFRSGRAPIEGCAP